MKSWHTKLEKEIIRRYGGKPLKKYGYDGVIRGRPVEVREARRDTRFRIQKNVHQTLVKNQGSWF